MKNELLKRTTMGRLLSPFGSLSHSLVTRLLPLLVMLFSIGIGNVLGANSVVTFGSGTLTTANGKTDKVAATSTDVADAIYVGRADNNAVSCSSNKPYGYRLSVVVYLKQASTITFSYTSTTTSKTETVISNSISKEQYDLIRFAQTDNKTFAEELTACKSSSDAEKAAVYSKFGTVTLSGKNVLMYYSVSSNAYKLDQTALDGTSKLTEVAKAVASSNETVDIQAKYSSEATIFPAGYYLFYLDNQGSTRGYINSVTFAPASSVAPAFASSFKTSYDATVGSPVTIGAAVESGNPAPTYSWRACDAQGNTTGDELATTATYSVTPSAVGVSYYKETATNSKGSDSKVITVTASAAPTLESIAIKTAPDKTVYTAGDKFDPTGLVITKTMSAGDPVDVTYTPSDTKFSFNPDLNTELTTSNDKVVVTYDGKEAEQDITVNAAPYFSMSYTKPSSGKVEDVACTNGSLSDATTVAGKEVSLESNDLKFTGNDTKLKVKLTNATIVEGTKIEVSWISLYKDGSTTTGIGIFDGNAANRTMNVTGIGGSSLTQTGTESYTFTAADAANYVSEFIITRNGSGKSLGVTGIKVYNVGAAPHTVTFDLNDESGNVNTQLVKDGQKVIKPTDPERTGYTFAGWNKGSVTYDFNSTVSADFTLTAQWTVAGNLTVRFFQGYGDPDVQIGDPQSVALNAFATAPNDPVRDGYKFKGWMVDGTLQTVAEYAITENTDFKAKWAAVKVVTIDKANSEDTYTVNVEENTALGAIESPVKAGYVFAGWYNGENAYDFSANVTEAFTLTAHWTAADANHYVYGYKDAFHYDGVTYHTPEGKVDNADGASNKEITTPYTLFSGDEGITSIVATKAIYDSKSNWVNSYLKINTNSDSYLTFTIKSGYTAELNMKMGGYSANPTVTLKDANDNVIAAASGTIEGVASKEDNFKMITYNLAGGVYTMTTATKTLYISSIDLQATVAQSYTIDCATAVNGKVQADKTSATAGEVVTLTITPDDGYVLDALNVKDASNIDVPVSNNKFTMPASAVTVNATFKENHVTPLVEISAKTTWNWDGAASADIVSTDANNIVVLGDADGWASTFNANALAGKAQYFFYKDNKCFQGSQLKFHPTVAGKISVVFSHTSGSKPSRELLVNGVSVGATGDNSSAKKTVSNISVAAGDVLLAGRVVADQTENMLRIYSVVFAPTHTLTFTNGGTIPAVTFAEGETITLPAADAVAGKDFAGWFDASTGGNKIGDADAEYVINATADAEFFAQYVDHAAVKIGDAPYGTLADAVSNAVAGDQLDLQEDINLDATQVVAKGIKINLNEHKLTGNGTRALQFTAGESEIMGSGIVTVTSGLDESSSAVRVGDNGSADVKLTIGKDVEVKSDYSYGVTIFGKNATEALVVYGKVTTDAVPAISGNGSAGLATTDIRIEDGAVITATNENAIYHPQAGNLYVCGTVTGKGGIEMKGGTLTTCGTANISATGAISHAVNNNGCSTSGYAIVMVQNAAYPGNPTAEISAGTITGSVEIVTDAAPAAGQEAKIEISGGSFSQVVPAEYCAEGFTPVSTPNAEGKYEVKKAYTFDSWDGSSLNCDKKDAAGNVEFTVYTITSDGEINASKSSTGFDAEQTVDDAGNKATTFGKQRFAIKFAKDVKSIDIRGYKGTDGYTLDAIKVSADGASKSYTDVITTKTAATVGAKNYQFLVNQHFEAGKYYWFEFSNSINVFDIFYTVSNVATHDKKKLTAGKVTTNSTDVALTEAQLDELNANHALTLSDRDAAYTVTLTENTVDIYDDGFEKEKGTPVSATSDEAALANNVYTATCTVDGVDYTVKANYMDVVAKIGDTGYATLAAAFAAVQTDETIKLIADVSEAVENATVASFALNLNGKTWSSAEGATLENNAAGSVITISGNGSITNDNDEGNAIWCRQGKVVITDGYYENNSNKEATILVGSSSAVCADQNVTVNGGTFKNVADGQYTYNTALKPLALNVQNSYLDDSHLANSFITLYAGVIVYGNDPSKGDDSKWGTSTFLPLGYEAAAQGTTPLESYKVQQITESLDVTESMTWDFSKASSTDTKSSGYVVLGNNSKFKNVANNLYIMANYNKVTNGLLQAPGVKFHMAVPGMLTIEAANTGKSNPERELYINGVATGSKYTGTTAKTYTQFVNAGDVELTVYEGSTASQLNYSSISFSTQAEPENYTLSVTAAGVATLCLPYETTIPNDGTKVYTLSDVQNNECVATEVIGTLAANTPVYVEATEGNHTFTATGSKADIEEDPTEGILHGVYQKTTLHHDGKTWGLTLYQGAGAFMQISSTKETWAEPYHCYMVYDYAKVGASNAPLRIVFPTTPGAVTGLDAISVEGENLKFFMNGKLFIRHNGILYDAAGMKVK